MSSNSVTRWGLAGAGRICQDFANAVATLNGHKLTAVAARDLDRAAEFAKQVSDRKSLNNIH